jgi:hypothetical protein
MKRRLVNLDLRYQKWKMGWRNERVCVEVWFSDVKRTQSDHLLLLRFPPANHVGDDHVLQ